MHRLCQGQKYDKMKRGMILNFNKGGFHFLAERVIAYFVDRNAM